VQVPSTTLTYTKMHRGEEVSVKVNAAEGYRLEEVSPTLCRKAVEIISQHRARGDGKPLFLYYASPLPHQPWTPAKAFAGKSGLGPYADVVMQFDEVVGQIMTALDRAGMAENTLVIFTSDNGPGPDAVRQMQAVDHAAAGGWRGKKAESWEGGHRVPFVVRWPGKVSAGEVTNATINFTDIFPTLVELTGGDPAKFLPLLQHDAGQSEQRLSADGISFLSVLRAPASAWQRPPMVHGQHGVRDGQWKLVSPARGTDAADVPDKSFGLYNLKKDPAEREDQTADFPEEAARLRAYYRQFAKQRTPKK
jgi:arylsulfatase A-like enzyme